MQRIFVTLHLVFPMSKTIAQFDKKYMGEIWDVWCKVVQSLMIGELKQIKISSLEFSIIAFLSLEYKEIL
jgi:hypothetical protein